MIVRAEQLDGHLARDLKPVYFINGDEPLLVEEAADAVRTACRAGDEIDREVLMVESGFDWERLNTSCDTLSLFAQKRLIELRVPTGKVGVSGSKAIQAFVEDVPVDTTLLVITGRLDGSARKGKWCKALEKAGAEVRIWPIEPRQLPQWIQQRMQAEGLRPSQDATRLLASLVEGNLLAARQEIEKLKLLHGEGDIAVDDVEEAVGDSTRFDVFTLTDAAMSGNARRASRVLRGLRREGTEPILILWALSREIQSACAMAWKAKQGTAIAQLLSAMRIPQKRHPGIRHALQRHDILAWQALLRRCAEVDRITKGVVRLDPWDALFGLTMGLVGLKPS